MASSIPNQDQIKKALTTVKYPGFSRDIVSFGLVRSAGASENGIEVQLALTTSDDQIPRQIKHEVEQCLATAFPGLAEINVVVAVQRPQGTPPPTAPGTSQPQANDQLSGVRTKIAIASGKGGVGKSTFAVNLACALARAGNPDGPPLRVGIMDCDIYGPSIPLMLGVHERPEIENDLIRPSENFGIRVMSMGFLVDEDTPVIWRGPMVMKTIQQFAQHVAWGELDILVVDLPPGTGDAQLSLVQTIPLDGAVIVTTPQAAATNVARRGARMFGQVNVPLLGVAENMSFLENRETGEKQYLFGKGGGEAAARELQTDFLGQVPLDPDIREGCDRGIPLVIQSPQSPASAVFRQMADSLVVKLRLR